MTKSIEDVVENARWDEVAKADLHALIAEASDDSAKLDLCDRKAYYLAEGRRLAQAIELLEWALAQFSTATGEPAKNARDALDEFRGMIS